MDTHVKAPHTNTLIHETSPYLLQHAHNPVNWQAWNPTALERGRREDKPILLSIGYSACHWCHVMEHESFEDEAVAQVMNELFVCIKVDREERPDLDKIYQTAHQMLAQRAGGWPLNMFLTPDDQTPFFGGTYFPKEPKYGLPGFVDLLRRVADYYRDHRDDIARQSAAVKEAFARIEQGGGAAPDVEITPAVLDRARRELGDHYDGTHGGFGGAPKFPHPTNIERLLRHWAARARPDSDGDPDLEARTMALQTLHAMAAGGLYDQLGGGFYRYSVDAQWVIPHFEKMLYDNGPLLALYADAYAASGDPFFRRIATETADWVQREMQSPAGGYYSTLDADSEGHEGKFYVWTPDEVRVLLSEEEFAALRVHYGLDRSPNFEHRWWHLHTYVETARVATQLGWKEERVAAVIASARTKLFAAREQRVRPGRDEKILTSWNGLMIKGMARAGRLLGRPDFVESAQRALDFVQRELWRDGRLLATAKDGRAHLNAYLDDYVFLADGVLELLQARWRTEDLEFVTALMDVVLDHFIDHENGAFFFTADDHEKLAYRPKPATDEAIPAGNGIAAQVLLRLGHLLGDSHYLDAAERTLKALYADVTRYPSAHNALLTAVEEYLHPPETIVVRGEAPAVEKWIARCSAAYAPRRFAFAIPTDAPRLPGALADREPGPGVVAYVCEGHACSAPINDLPEFEHALRQTEVRP
jgi:uncharacterized protein YyaL (SSP411 family)